MTSRSPGRIRRVRRRSRPADSPGLQPGVRVCHGGAARCWALQRSPATSSAKAWQESASGSWRPSWGRATTGRGPVAEPRRGSTRGQYPTVERLRGGLRLRRPDGAGAGEVRRGAGGRGPLSRQPGDAAPGAAHQEPGLPVLGPRVRAAQERLPGRDDRLQRGPGAHRARRSARLHARRPAVIPGSAHHALADARLLRQVHHPLSHALTVASKAARPPG
jgi:hypothetical protein